MRSQAWHYGPYFTCKEIEGLRGDNLPIVHSVDYGTD